MAFFGMQFALASVFLGFVGIATGHKWAWADCLGALCLAIWALLTSAQAVVALTEIK